MFTQRNSFTYPQKSPKPFLKITLFLLDLTAILKSLLGMGNLPVQKHDTTLHTDMYTWLTKMTSMCERFLLSENLCRPNLTILFKDGSVQAEFLRSQSLEVVELNVCHVGARQLDGIFLQSLLFGEWKGGLVVCILGFVYFHRLLCYAGCTTFNEGEKPPFLRLPSSIFFPIYFY